MTKTAFSKIIKLIADLFPQSKTQFTKDVIEAWYEALSDSDYERMRKGIIKYAQNNQWSPTIADIRKYTSAIAEEKDIEAELRYAEELRRREYEEWKASRMK